jgi:hypothetical protein
MGSEWASGRSKGLETGGTRTAKGTGRQRSLKQEARISRAIVDRRVGRWKLPFALWMRAAVRDYIAHAHPSDLNPDEYPHGDLKARVGNQPNSRTQGRRNSTPFTL